MSTELTPVEVGELVPTLAESEATIRETNRNIERKQRRAVEGMEEARGFTELGERKIGTELTLIQTARTFTDKDYRSFTAYMRDAQKNLGISERHAWRMLRGTDPNQNGSVNERQQRELGRIPEEKRDVVLAVAASLPAPSAAPSAAPVGKITAAKIREAYERVEAGDGGIPEAEVVERPERDLLVAWAGELWEGDTAIAAYDGTTIGQVKAWVREVVR